jgi:hypothetical protein
MVDLDVPVRRTLGIVLEAVRRMRPVVEDSPLEEHHMVVVGWVRRMVAVDSVHHIGLVAEHREVDSQQVVGRTAVVDHMAAAVRIAVVGRTAAVVDSRPVAEGSLEVERHMAAEEEERRTVAVEDNRPLEVVAGMGSCLVGEGHRTVVGTTFSM